MELGEFIKKVRMDRKLSVRKFAELTGISHPYLSQLETGICKNPSIEVISKITNLGVSKLYLYKLAGFLDETDILELVDENKKLKESLQRACDSLGADIEDYL